MAINPSAMEGSGLALQAVTPQAGFALQNGTPVIVSWTAPNDGQQHYFQFGGSRNVTVLEVGGQITLTFTPPGGAAQVTIVIAAGGSGVGDAILNPEIGVIGPGTTVTLQQTSALTSGACMVSAAIWGV